MADAWRPANELEHRMREAVQAGDQETYFRLLGQAELVVPVPPGQLDDVLANQAQPTWPTREEDGHFHVLAYTSPAAMRECIGPEYRHFVALRFTDVAAAWPDVAWWLAVDSGLPIEGRLPSWFIRQIAEGDPRPPQVGRPRTAAAPQPAAQPAAEPAAEPAPEPQEARQAADVPVQRELPQQPEVTGERDVPAPREAPVVERRPEFQSANDVERELLRAVGGGDQDTFLKVLAAAEVLLPVPPDADYSNKPGRAGFVWQTGELDGNTVIWVFTSVERMRDLTGETALRSEFITLPFATMARYWPDHGLPLAVNSGTPVGAVLPGERLKGLSEWADQRTAQRLSEDFAPQNDIEGRLFAAASRRDGDAYFQALAGSQVLVPSDPETPWGIAPDDAEFPWRPVPVRGAVSIQVFTSLKWMHEVTGPSRFIMPSFAQMLAGWPDERWQLVINPGTPINAVVSGDRVRALAETARRAAPPTPEAAPPTPEAAPPAPEAVRATPEAVQAVPEAAAPEQADWVPARGAAEAAPAEVGSGGVDQAADQGVDQPASPQTPAEAGPEPEPSFEPGNRIDQELYEAALAGDTDAFLRVLLAANVLVPIPADAPLEVTPLQQEFRWESALRGPSSVQIFTSLVRLREALPGSRFVYADFRELISSWPRADWTMVLNPGTRIGASLQGDQVQALSEWAVRVGLIQARPRPEGRPSFGDPNETVADLPPAGRTGDPAQTMADPLPAEDPTQTMLDPPGRPVAGAAAPHPERAVANGAGDPNETVADLEDVVAEATAQAPPDVFVEGREAVVLQKVVPHGHVGWYLEQGYDRVGGFVHPVADVTELQTPAQLYETLGLLYEGSPFTPPDEGVYVIRWPAYCSDLYRIPFGGQSEQELLSWGEAGWVQERPPFVGNGFAPGSAGSIREYKVDSARLPYGAEMYYLGGDRSEQFVAMYDPDRLAWVRPGADEEEGAMADAEAGN